MRHRCLIAVFILAFIPSAPCRAQYIVAHRGASHDAPENTLAAFRLAWEQNADAIEGDFYVTKDHQIVCTHDSTTKRIVPGQTELKIADSTLKELQRLDVGSWKSPRFKDERMPTLKDVLAVVPPGKRIFVEIKCGPEILPLMKPQLEQSGLMPDQIVIICFNETVIKAARELMPQFKANWLTGYKQDKETKEWSPKSSDVMAVLKRTHATGLGTHGNVDVANAALAHSVLDAELEFHVWTINDPADALHFSALGAHSITTDKPGAIRTALEMSATKSSAAELPPFEIERLVMTKGYNGTNCWVHARAGVIPASDPGTPPLAVMTSQPLMITGSDVFYALNSAISRDLGKTWSPLTPQTEFERWKIDERTEETICDFTPAWHQATKTMLGTGQTVRYFDNKVMDVRPRSTAYSVYDQATNTWGKPQTLKMPGDTRFQNCGAGSVQRFDLPDGDILLPVYFKDPQATQYSVTVCLCHFDGTDMTYVRHGSELTVDVKRGLYEPSITRFGDRFYLTLRNDDHGYVASSTDGLHYDSPRQWTFDDGSELGNYNTQQHWVTHPAGLFLIYTRRGANNDHVFRHRAPLFIAQVDPEKLHVIRSTEQILVPERGARLGNFGVVNVTAQETWVVAAEWMQTWGPRIVIPVDNKYGADNSIHIAKLKWSSQNP
ncbi:MAG: glycerophosphodiester phosphodiesterase family protein [Planctomycetaceae bacterium]